MRRLAMIGLLAALGGGALSASRSIANARDCLEGEPKPEPNRKFTDRRKDAEAKRLARRGKTSRMRW